MHVTQWLSVPSMQKSLGSIPITVFKERKGELEGGGGRGEERRGKERRGKEDIFQFRGIFCPAKFNFKLYEFNSISTAEIVLKRSSFGLLGFSFQSENPSGHRSQDLVPPHPLPSPLCSLGSTCLGCRIF